MAHGDYDCCAVCDSKMAYNPDDAQAKKELCGECIKRARRVTGAVMTTGADLATWVETAPLEQVAALRISPCFFGNDVDQLVRTRVDELVRNTRTVGLLPAAVDMLAEHNHAVLRKLTLGVNNTKEEDTDGN